MLLLQHHFDVIILVNTQQFSFNLLNLSVVENLVVNDEKEEKNENDEILMMISKNNEKKEKKKEKKNKNKNELNDSSL